MRSLITTATGLALLLGCGPSPSDVPEVAARIYTEEREPCADFDARRQLLWGDLHVHTGYSFDAWGYGNRHPAGGGYAFARGEEVTLPPLDENEVGTRTARIDRPLDFAMISDHGEFIGEVLLCTDPTSVAYDHPICAGVREDPDQAALLYGTHTAMPDPARMDLCPDGSTGCIEEAAGERWTAIQEAAEAYYDRTAACEFVTFVGYEYTGTPGVSNNHRNVLFRTAAVPDLPVTYYEAPTAAELWDGLNGGCWEGVDGCDVLTIAHNSNLSNGTMFEQVAPDAGTVAEELRVADLRARMEPLMEVFQHKGDAECRNGPGGAELDPLCDFEKLWPDDADDCGEETGSGGMRLWGCVSRRDFVRGILGRGLEEDDRLGFNPYRLGLLAATDTHNTLAGHTVEDAFPGHIGTVDDTPEERLGDGTLTHDAFINNPGGLAAVWAEEASRDSLFSALRRREVYGTSGPRIAVRFFGGWGLDEGLCEIADRAPDAGPGAADRVTLADDAGVPMGGVLDASSGSHGAPTLAVWATADPGTDDHPGAGLQRIQIVKGWLDGDGVLREEVIDVAGDTDVGSPPAPDTCATTEGGFESLCAVWTDPDFTPGHPAFYYARVLQVPTCRWSTHECQRLPPDDRPELCDTDDGALVIQERAWTSPIHVGP